MPQSGIDLPARKSVRIGAEDAPRNSLYVLIQIVYLALESVNPRIKRLKSGVDYLALRFDALAKGVSDDY